MTTSTTRETSKAAPGRRPGATFTSFFGNARARIHPVATPPLAWTASMTVLAMVGVYLSFLAHFLDGAAIAYVRQNQDFKALTTLASITDIGKTYWYLVPAAVFLVAIALVDWKGRSRQTIARLALGAGQSIFVLLGVGLGEILANIIKIFFGRARPQLFDTVGPEHFSPFSTGYSYASFPSGHAITMGVMAMTLMIWFPRLRIPAFLVGALLASSRVASQSHYPSDVVVSFCGGLLFALYLARWLALRGVVFHLRGNSLIPLPRFSGSLARRAPTA